MAKPFSIQAPEDIAKEYAGNKQRIAQAAQMGIVDPTAAVLAGMFIDRMRGAQMQEGANPPSVAQEVMGGAPPAPPAPLPTAGGLGASPQAAPPMAPPMDMPMPGGAPMGAPMGEAPMPMPGGAPTGEAPIGMADGGLATLPVPDAMFDEPDDGGYAGGGLVAFAKGGVSDLYDDVEYWESGGDQSAVSPAGARGVMQLMPGTMRDPGFGVPPMAELMKQGLSEEEANRTAGRKYLDAMFRKYGDRTTALMAYNWGPGNVDKWLKSGADPKKVPAETRKYVRNILEDKASPPVPERNIGTAEGRARSTTDEFERLQGLFGPTKEEQEVDAARMARAKEMASDEYYEKQRKSDMWQTLAEIGFNMASSKSPYLLQAIGEAAAASMPGARADKKERQELKNRALDAMAAMNGLKRKENLQLYSLAVDAAKTGMEQEQFEAQMGLKREELDLAERKLDTELAIAMAKGEDPKDRVVRYMLDFPKGSPEYEAASNYLEKTRSSTSSGALTPEQIRANVEAGRGGGGGGGVIDFSALTPPK